MQYLSDEIERAQKRVKTTTKALESLMAHRDAEVAAERADEARLAHFDGPISREPVELALQAVVRWLCPDELWEDNLTFIRLAGVSRSMRQYVVNASGHYYPRMIADILRWRSETIAVRMGPINHYAKVSCLVHVKRRPWCTYDKDTNRWRPTHRSYTGVTDLANQVRKTLHNSERNVLWGPEINPTSITLA